MNIPSNPNRLQVTRLIKAPRERVFAAWTMPAMIPHWFGPANCQVIDVAIDLRVGGHYRFVASTEEYGAMAVIGVYREITAPSKLVFTWQWEGDPDWTQVESIVTVDLVEKPGGTEVRITHEGFPTAEHIGRHEHGWNGCLDKLAARADALAELSGPGHFSWNELLTSDVDLAGDFYTKLFGWTATPMAEGVPYLIFKQNGLEVGGMMALPMPGIPPHWLSYVTVESIDASTARLAELGGQICKPPFDVPNVGRIAIVQDPQGAWFGLFQPVS